MITMDGLSDNQYGVAFNVIDITALRLHKTDGKWLVEYRRVPRTMFFWDRWWWYNDGTYVEYIDAKERIDYLSSTKRVIYPKFQEMTVIELSDTEDDEVDDVISDS